MAAYRTFSWAGALSLILFPFFVLAVTGGSDQLVSQQQRQEALEEHLKPRERRVTLSSSHLRSGLINFPQESPCFLIKQVMLEGRTDLPSWLPLRRITAQAEGQCLGGKGVNLLMKTLQNRLVGYGYITSRIFTPKQDLKNGQLKLLVVAGRVGDVRLSAKSDRYLNLYTTFPGSAGDVLNLRDLEQGMENLLRLPTVGSEIAIIPGKNPAESDVEISWRQEKKWRLDMSLDDSGLNSTGRYQGNLTLSVDNPLSLSDLFYISASRELQRGHKEKNSRNVAAHYSVPFGYWLAGVTGSKYTYRQLISGIFSDYRYSGEIENLNAWVRRVLHHNAVQKTTVSWSVMAKRNRNYFEDTELEIQRRQTAAWLLSLQHEHRIGVSSLTVGASYQRGTRWFGAQPAPEELSGQATALGKIVRLNARVNYPFTVAGQPFRYNASYFRQITSTPLTPQDQLAMGNRWSVRGFDGQRVLSASRGWYIRNDFAWRTPLSSPQELYLGIDYGEVAGYTSTSHAGKHLAGGVIGLRGNVLNIGYDVFAGIPLSRPEGFTTSKVALGFNTSWSF